MHRAHGHKGDNVLRLPLARSGVFLFLLRLTQMTQKTFQDLLALMAGCMLRNQVRRPFIFSPINNPQHSQAPSVSLTLAQTHVISLAPRGSPGGRRTGPASQPPMSDESQEAPGNQGACPRPWGSQQLGLEQGCLAQALTEGLFHCTSTLRQLTTGLFRFQTSRSLPSSRVPNNKAPVCARKRAQESGLMGSQAQDGKQRFLYVPLTSNSIGLKISLTDVSSDV